jgi:hypothetical protein
MTWLWEKQNFLRICINNNTDNDNNHNNFLQHDLTTANGQSTLQNWVEKGKYENDNNNNNKTICI